MQRASQAFMSIFPWNLKNSCGKVGLVITLEWDFCFYGPALVNQNENYVALETSFINVFFRIKKIINQACIALPA